MMIHSIVPMLNATIALIFACILGVSGLISDVRFTDSAMVVRHRQPWGVAFGGIAFANAYNVDHEIGHLEQERQLGALYIPIVGIPSLISAIVAPEQQRGMWFERWADVICD